MEDWAAELRQGRSEGAWDLFVSRYRRLIFAAIRHYAQDYDDVMDVFARVCDALRADELGKLRTYIQQPDHRAKFSTWLVTVVRHLTVDWFRHRDGRHRLSAVAESLPPLQRQIFEQVFLERRSHVETYELLTAAGAVDVPFARFLAQVAATYRAVMAGRRGMVLRELGAPSPPEAEVSETEATADQRELLQAALASLSNEDRLVVELYVVDELPAESVAQVLGLPNAKAVYNRVYRVLAALRARLEQAGIHLGDL